MSRIINLRSRILSCDSVDPSNLRHSNSETQTSFPEAYFLNRILPRSSRTLAGLPSCPTPHPSPSHPFSSPGTIFSLHPLRSFQTPRAALPPSRIFPHLARLLKLLHHQRSLFLPLPSSHFLDHPRSPQAPGSDASLPPYPQTLPWSIPTCLIRNSPSMLTCHCGSPTSFLSLCLSCKKPGAFQCHHCFAVLDSANSRPLRPYMDGRLLRKLRARGSSSLCRRQLRPGRT